MASCSNSRAAKEAKRESTTMGPNWLELPRELTLSILQRLSAFEIVMSVCQVCPLWWNICKDPIMWRTIHMTEVGSSFYNLEESCRYAVDRSCGLLEDIHIEDFGTDELLKYIADSTSHLRRLQLVKCWRISNQGWIEAVTKLSRLEELDISYTSFNLYAESLEFTGRCCPLLKSLMFRGAAWPGHMYCDLADKCECDDEVFAIAKTMPRLRHLYIYGNSLTNIGLLAILEGCPLLESLDLRSCLNVDLGGSLGKRCREQIKDLHFGGR